MDSAVVKVCAASFIQYNSTPRQLSVQNINNHKDVSTFIQVSVLIALVTVLATRLDAVIPNAD